MLIFNSGKLSIPGAILWLYGPIQKWHFVDDDDDDENMTNGIDGLMDRVLHSAQALESIHRLRMKWYTKWIQERHPRGCFGLSLLMYSCYTHDHEGAKFWILEGILVWAYV